MTAGVRESAMRNLLSVCCGVILCLGIIVRPAAGDGGLAGHWRFDGCDGAAVKLYVNGKLSAEKPRTGPITRNGQPLILGRRGCWSCWTVTRRPARA